MDPVVPVLQSAFNEQDSTVSSIQAELESSVAAQESAQLKRLKEELAAMRREDQGILDASRRKMQAALAEESQIAFASPPDAVNQTQVAWRPTAPAGGEPEDAEVEHLAARLA